MKEYYDFNINETVKVKLTDVGRQILKKDREEFWLNRSNRPFNPPKEDDEGYSEWQMWALMQAFSHHIGMSEFAPYDTTIKIPISRQECPKDVPIHTCSYDVAKEPLLTRLSRWMRKRRVDRLKVEIAGEHVRTLQLKNWASNPADGYQFTERHLRHLVRLERLKAELEILDGGEK